MCLTLVMKIVQGYPSQTARINFDFFRIYNVENIRSCFFKKMPLHTYYLQYIKRFAQKTDGDLYFSLLT